METAWRVRNTHSLLFPFKNHFYVKRGVQWEYYISNVDFKKPVELELTQISEILSVIDGTIKKIKTTLAQLSGIDSARLRIDSIPVLFAWVDAFVAECIENYEISSSHITDYLIERLAASVGASRHQLLQLLSSPVPDLMEMEMFEWRSSIQTIPYSRQAVASHVNKYPLLALGFHARRDVLTHLKNMYARRVGDRTETLASWVVRKTESRQRRQDSILSALQPSPDDRLLLGLIQAIGHSRVQLKQGWGGLNWFMLPVFERLSTTFDIGQSDLVNLYSKRDICNLALRGTKVVEGVLAARRQCVLWEGTGEVHQGAAGIERCAILLGSGVTENSAGSHRLFGTVASAGRAEGFVYVVQSNNPESMTRARLEMPRGGVLVTEMAQPSMLDLMSKCAAVVTNEGGLLSHAAIICRELKKPCVVGVVGATTKLKNGDRVLITTPGRSGTITVLENSKQISSQTTAITTTKSNGSRTR
jgi:phosphohistidine swiveling domain-containing protein